MVTVSIPRFYLYGEPHRSVEEGFVHAERLDDRSRPNEWTILPHAHADLVQAFVLDRGGGTMRAEDAHFDVEAPALLLIPSGIVHGFSWSPESIGSVITLAVRHLASLDSRYPGLAQVFARPRAVSLESEAWSALHRASATLMRELGWLAPGHCAAVDAALLAFLVEAGRTFDTHQGTSVPPPGQHVALVARYRARIDERFRLREPIAVHAAALGASESRLRIACTRIAGRSPGALLDERAMFDAKRALLYTNLSIAEVGYAVGFSDPAYFSRFFTRHAGLSPKIYRSSGSK